MRKYRDNEKSGKLENFWWEVYHQLLWKRSMIIWRIIGKAIRLLYQCFKPSKYLMRVKFISDLSPSEDKPQEVGQLIAGIRPEFSTSWKWAFGLGNSECLRENIEKYCHSRSCRLCFIFFFPFCGRSWTVRCSASSKKYWISMKRISEIENQWI